VVPWSACFENFLAAETLEDWFSSALGRKGLAGKTQRFKTFPKYLLVQLKRYFVDETWTPRKLEATVDMPDELDLTPFRSDGRQPGEVALPEDGEGAPASAAPAPAPLQPDPAAVATIESMGFSANAAARALLAVQNASAEHAMQWIFDHMDDADLNDPLPAPSTAAAPAPASTATSAEPDPEVVANLAAMLGFADKHVKAALKATNNDSERAADWLFSHADDLDSAVAAVEGASSGASGGGAGAAVTEDRADVGKYQLVGFISHIGRNTGSGHYVAHIRKGGRWVIYDDQKVALSEHPPRGLGYLYLYARVDPDSMVM
jgi:ubiquitin carboxyl-terminal hydrolase 5/13